MITIVETIVKTITRIKIHNVINNTNQIKLVKYKNFANTIYSKNIIVYQFEYFFTKEKIEYVNIVKKTIKLSIKYHNFIDVFNKKTFI